MISNELKQRLCETPVLLATPEVAVNWEDSYIDGFSQSTALAVFQLLLTKLIDEGEIHVDERLLHSIGFYEGDKDYGQDIICYPFDSSIDIDGPLWAVVVVSMLREYGWTVDSGYIFSPSAIADDCYGQNGYFTPEQKGAFHEDSVECLTRWYGESLMKEYFRGLYDEEYLMSGCTEDVFDFFKKKSEEGALDSDDVGELFDQAEMADKSDSCLMASITYDLYKELDLDAADEFEHIVGPPPAQFICVFHKRWQEIKAYYKTKDASSFSAEITELYDECCRLHDMLTAGGLCQCNSNVWFHDGKEYDVEMCYPVEDPDGGLGFINPLMQINCGNVVVYAKEFDEKVNRLLKMVLEAT